MDWILAKWHSLDFAALPLSEYIIWERIFWAVGVFLFFWLLKNLITNYIYQLLIKFTEKYHWAWGQGFFTAMRIPLRNFLVLFGTYVALRNCLAPTFHADIQHFYRTGVIIVITHALILFLRQYMESESKIFQKLHPRADNILLPFLIKVARFVLVFLALMTIAATWGYDVNGFLAGLGLGGLAVALAAKELLSNIFSGFVIISDRFFQIGDWVKTGDVEGSIEEINFRSTKIRTSEHCLVIVPNSKLVDNPMYNYSKRSQRKVSFNLRLDVGSSAPAMEQLVSDIRACLESHDQVDSSTILVNFDIMDAEGFSCFVYFMTNTSVWKEHLRIKQEVNLEILGLLAKNRMRLAVPRRTLLSETGQELTEEVPVE